MNIFALHDNPVTAAAMLCDKHVVKMTLESAQMLSTVAGGPYKPTHINHPCTQWTRESPDNYLWLFVHAEALCAQYMLRYGGRIHKCMTVLTGIPASKLRRDARCVMHTPFVQCMPDEFKQADPVKAYRAYYKAKSLQMDMRWFGKRDAVTTVL